MSCSIAHGFVTFSMMIVRGSFVFVCCVRISRLKGFAFFVLVRVRVTVFVVGGILLWFKGFLLFVLFIVFAVLCFFVSISVCLV